MKSRLEPIRQVLCALSEDALIELRDAAIESRHLAPSFTAWIKHAVDWERDRRAGAHYFLLFPEELEQPDEFARGARPALAEIDATLRKALVGGTDDVLDALEALVWRCEQYR